MRQLTVASALAGSAFFRVPAETSVATHVVRSVAPRIGFFSIVASAVAGTAPFAAAAARSAAANGAGSTAALASK
ncbi:hypothetical protein D3C83_83780 [compost metagenome]